MTARHDDLPFFAGNDFKQNLLAGTFAGTEVGDEVFFGDFTPGGGREDSATAAGHLRVGGS